jgi:Uma2 family endonuclease
MQGLFAYPDLVVVCGALQFHDQARDVLLNPTVIVEVLSPSTEAFDRGEKFRRYRTWLPTLTDYVLVAQEGPLIDHYHRQEDGTWVLRALEGLQANMHLGTIGCTVPLADVYERIMFPTALAAEEPAG